MARAASFMRTNSRSATVRPFRAPGKRPANMTAVTSAADGPTDLGSSRTVCLPRRDHPCERGRPRGRPIMYVTGDWTRDAFKLDPNRPAEPQIAANVAGVAYILAGP